MYRRDKSHEEKARKNAMLVMEHWDIPTEPTTPRICVILGGAGWGDVPIMPVEHSFALVPTDNWRCRPILMDFYGLKELPEHKRVVEYGHVSGKEVLVLKGRVHLNEGVEHPHYKFYARLQIEMLIQMGAATLISTSAAASFRKEVRLGDIIVTSGFSGDNAPEMPLEAFEKPRAETVLDPALRHLACEMGKEAGLRTYEGGVAMVRGPLVPILSCDLPSMRSLRADVAVTSILTEAMIAALYPDTRMLGLSLVSIAEDGADFVQTPEHTAKRGELLKGIITRLP